MKENGKMINKMVMERNNGQMVQNIKDNMKMVRNMAKDYYNLQMGHFIMENLIIMIYMEKVFDNNNCKVDMFGQIKENMKDNGLTIRCIVWNNKMAHGKKYDGE